MRSPFDRMLANADRAADRVIAERFTLHPQVRTPNGPASPDPARQRVDGRGIFQLHDGEAGGVQIGNRTHSRSRNDLALQVTNRKRTLSIAVAELAGVRPTQGDRVDLVDRSPPHRYEVKSAQPDGHGRFVIHLVSL